MSTRQGRDYQEVAAVTAAIAAVAAASKADAEADTVAAGIGAVVAPSQDEADETEAIEAAVIDFAASVELDDEHEDDDSFATARGAVTMVVTGTVVTSATSSLQTKAMAITRMP